MYQTAENRQINFLNMYHFETIFIDFTDNNR